MKTVCAIVRATQNFNPSLFLLQSYFTRTNEASWGNLRVSASKLSEMTACQSLQIVFDYLQFRKGFTQRLRFMIQFVFSYGLPLRVVSLIDGFIFQNLVESLQTNFRKGNIVQIPQTEPTVILQSFPDVKGLYQTAYTPCIH